MTESITAKQLARRFGSDGRTVRKFLRKELGHVGQGQRWNIEEKDVPDLQAAWIAWREPIETRAAARQVRQAEVEEPEDGDSEEELEI